MRVSADIKLDFDDVLIRPKSSTLISRNGSILRTFSKWRNAKNCGEFIWAPIIAANMGTTGTIAMAQELKKHNMLTALHKFYSIEQLKSIKNITANTFISIGQNTEKLAELAKLKEYMKIDLICIDVANGYTEKFLEFCTMVRYIFPDSVIMAGNVCTPDRTEELIRYGKVDIVKIGIGPGACCTTRIVAGIGYPQLSAISECADAAHGIGGYICGDGGCKNTGDINKALCAGADLVMLGGIFAGADECEGEWEYENIYIEEQQKVTGAMREVTKKKSLVHYGMSSHYAQEKHLKEKRDYRPSEGKVVKVPYKGPVKDIVRQIKGGICSCCTYIGAREIKDMPKCASFIRVNNTHNTSFDGGEEI